MALKTLADKPKKPIFATAYVASLEPSVVSSSGKNMRTDFQLFLNGPAAGEAQNGTKVMLTWNPTWFRPTFDIVALDAEVERLNVRIAQGDQEAVEAKALINSPLWTARMNIFDDPRTNVPTIRGLIGGRTHEEHEALWEQFCTRVQELGAANPEAEDEQADAAAQDAIVKGVDEFLQEFFGPNSLAGKFLAVTYGQKKTGTDEATKQPIYSKWRNVLKFVIPGAKTDMAKRLEGWRKSCDKPESQTVYMVDDSEPFGSTSF